MALGPIAGNTQIGMPRPYSATKRAGRGIVKGRPNDPSTWIDLDKKAWELHMRLWKFIDEQSEQEKKDTLNKAEALNRKLSEETKRENAKKQLEEQRKRLNELRNMLGIKKGSREDSLIRRWEEYLAIDPMLEIADHYGHALWLENVEKRPVEAEAKMRLVDNLLKEAGYSWKDLDLYLRYEDAKEELRRRNQQKQQKERKNKKPRRRLIVP